MGLVKRPLYTSVRIVEPTRKFQRMSDIQTVSDIPENYQLITGSHERDTVLSHVGIDPQEYSHGSIFVRVNQAEYTDVYFFGGNVPYLAKSVTKIY
jgi:hypothetical protein